MEAAQALADLTEISAQIEAAVLAQADGSVVASTFSDGEKGEPFAAAAAELVRSAQNAGGADVASRELVQVQAATPQGCIFVVRDDRHLVAAVTGPQPTVGLVFYDLKSCLRLVDRDAPEEKKAASRKRVRKEAGSGS
jgi:predicted regulator of Ras-like GTPase activity (Roadblock/LC7/MglB family)